MIDYPHLLAYLGAAWILQIILSFEQMRRFRGRLVELRRLGRTAVGLGGGKYRGRAYAIVVADAQGHVMRAEVMSGVSVFARLKEVPEVQGYELSGLLNSPPDLGGKKSAALKAAAAALLKGAEPVNRTALQT